MKNFKKILTILFVSSCFSVANAQLMVDETGKTGLGIETTGSLNSQLTVNSLGESNVTMYLNSQDFTGLKINRTSQSGSSYGLYITNHPSGFENHGVYSRNTISTGTRTAYSSYGVTGIAGGANNGYNFGVAGFLDDVYGAGVFGSSVGILGNVSVTGKYAGFFHGDVYLTGSLNVPTLVSPSDYRLKSDIKSVSSSCLDKVMDMNIVEFKYKQREFEATEGAEASREKRAPWYDEESAFMKNKHYGFIAQELQKIYPDLVVEGEDGYLGVNYLEIIPLLVRSVQELNVKLEQQSNGIVKKAATRSADEEATNIDAIVSALYQNTPNPFTESTLIRCDVAEDVIKADLYVYDMNGKQIAVYPIAERGATSIIIEGHSLEAGMYLYALITDGQVIDTKRMILTR